MRSLFPEDDGNGLSEELFACNTVDRVLPFTGMPPFVSAAQMISQHTSMLSCSLTLGTTVLLAPVQVCTSLTLYGMGHCQAAVPLQYI